MLKYIKYTLRGPFEEDFYRNENLRPSDCVHKGPLIRGMSFKRSPRSRESIVAVGLWSGTPQLLNKLSACV